MRRIFLFSLLIACSSAAAQSKPPKVDSLLATLELTKDEASDAVVAAFTQAGLMVTDQTSSTITADLGETRDELSSFHRRRIVRATLLPSAEVTLVLIQGTEDVRKGDRPVVLRKIDNKARGNGGKVWRKMLKAARALDSTSVDSTIQCPGVAHQAEEGRQALRWRGHGGRADQGRAGLPADTLNASLLGSCPSCPLSRK